MLFSHLFCVFLFLLGSRTTHKKLFAFFISEEILSNSDKYGYIAASALPFVYPGRSSHLFLFKGCRLVQPYSTQPKGTQIGAFHDECVRIQT